MICKEDEYVECDKNNDDNSHSSSSSSSSSGSGLVVLVVGTYCRKHAVPKRRQQSTSCSCEHQKTTPITAVM